MASLREKMRARGELLLAHAPILTLGCTLITTLSLMTLATTSVLSTALLIKQTEKNTSVGSTSGLLESLEVKAGEFVVKVTGNSTTEVLTTLREMLKSMDAIPLKDASYHYMEPKAM